MEAMIPPLDDWIRVYLARFSVGVLTAVLVLVLGLLVARGAAGAARAAMLRTPLRSRALLVNFLTRTVRVVVSVFAGVIALSQLGLDIGPLIAGIGVTGFIVGFAFKDSLSNLAAGLLLLFYQPFEIGDLVEAGGQTGTVLDMSIAATELKMPDGRLAIVPNSRIWNAHIINFNRLGLRRIEWALAISNSADLGEALKSLRDVVVRDPRVLREPRSQVVVNALRDSVVDLVVRA